MLQVEEYVSKAGNSPFQRWFDGLKSQAQAKVAAALYRMEQGNMGDVAPVGAGVYERRIHWGPGLRVYFGRDGGRLIVLLGGGSKHRQQRDIAAANKHWKEYRQEG